MGFTLQITCNLFRQERLGKESDLAMSEQWMWGTVPSTACSGHAEGRRGTRTLYRAHLTSGFLIVRVTQHRKGLLPMQREVSHPPGEVLFCPAVGELSLCP